MFEKLQAKWKVSGHQFFAILCTFAIGGSLVGFLGKKIMSFLPLEKGILWIVLYIIVVSVAWPFIVLTISIPLGQFNFFKQYIRKLGRQIWLKVNKKIKPRYPS